MWRWFSILFTSTFATVYLTNHYDYISKTQELLLSFKESLRLLSLRFHNWLFNDSLVSFSKIESDINEKWSEINNLIDEINNILVYINKTLEVMESTAINGALEILKERVEKGSSYSDLAMVAEDITETISNSTIDWTYATYAIAPALTI